MLVVYITKYMKNNLNIVCCKKKKKNDNWKKIIWPEKIIVTKKNVSIDLIFV